MKVFSVSRGERFELSSTSKGNQTKWVKGNKFLKADTMGYESIAEVLASEVEKATKGIDYVDYFLCKIVEDDITSYYGCVSDIFTSKDDSIISLYSILKKYYGGERVLKEKLGDIVGVDLVNTILAVVSKVTGISYADIKNYLSTIVRLDAILLNEDRHFNNIAFIKNNGDYRFCPIFDNGLSFLSDTNDYPLDKKGVSHKISRVKSQPFSRDWRKQIGYFDDGDLLHIDINSLRYRLENYTVDFKKEEYERALEVLKSRLKTLKGVAWE